MKTMNRNQHVMCMANNIVKGKGLGFRNIQDEEVITCHDKEKLEQKILNYDCDHFSKVKESEAHDDKMHNNIIDDDIRDKC